MMETLELKTGRGDCPYGRSVIVFQGCGTAAHYNASTVRPHDTFIGCDGEKQERQTVAYKHSSSGKQTFLTLMAEVELLLALLIVPTCANRQHLAAAVRLFAGPSPTISDVFGQGHIDLWRIEARIVRLPSRVNWLTYLELRGN